LKIKTFSTECLPAQRTSQGEAIHKQQKELEFSAERDERLKKELEVCGG
jgi:hypothetical protein